jgi:hypothetical protein
MKSRLYGSIYDDPEMMDLIEKSKKRIFIINPPLIRISKKGGHLSNAPDGTIK